MMLRILIAIHLVLGAVLAGCGKDDGLRIEYAHGWVSPDCAPWDGPATLVYLTDTAADSIMRSSPHLMLSIWRDVSSIGTRPIELGSATATARRCDSAGTCENAEVGSIRFSEAARGLPARGTYRLRFRAQTITGQFDATWLERQVFCL